MLELVEKAEKIGFSLSVTTINGRKFFELKKDDFGSAIFKTLDQVEAFITGISFFAERDGVVYATEVISSNGNESEDSEPDTSKFNETLAAGIRAAKLVLDGKALK